MSCDRRELVDWVFSQKSLLCSSSEKYFNNFRRDDVGFDSFILKKLSSKITTPDIVQPSREVVLFINITLPFLFTLT